MKLSSNLILLKLLTLFGLAYADYYSDRASILVNESIQLLGSSINLTEDEQKVNDILMSFKLQEYDDGFADPSKFLPSIHFFRSKSAIEQSEVFKLIQKIPKGASLHSHSSAMLSFEGLYQLTYNDNLYGCDTNGTFQLNFFFDTVGDDCDWKLLSEWRSADSQFDDFLKSQLTLVVDDPAATYGDINAVWDTFEDIFTLTSPLFKYRQFLHDYLYQVFQEFHDDNVMYMEIRAGMSSTYDSNGTVYNASQTVQLYLDTLSEFSQKNPDFLGFRIIYAKSRDVDNQTIAGNIATLLTLQNEYPDAIAGFDLVGQEDLGEPLSAFADQLIAIADQTKFYFHAGETNWYGSTTDLNLVDAIALNASRIGHAFAISKHPQVLALVKDKNIAIEINPLSNQVLKLVDDLRNHVGATLIARGYPVVVTCDDPTFWGAKGLSYDWYMTFMAMTPRDGDLKILKQLALNSLTYSSLSQQDLPYAMALLQTRWDDFVQAILEEYQ